MIPTHLDPLWAGIAEADDMRRLARVEERAAVHVDTHNSQRAEAPVGGTSDNSNRPEREVDDGITSKEADIGEEATKDIDLWKN
jgi:hypothetical protein